MVRPFMWLDDDDRGAAISDESSPYYTSRASKQLLSKISPSAYRRNNVATNECNGIFDRDPDIAVNGQSASVRSSHQKRRTSDPNTSERAKRTLSELPDIGLTAARVNGHAGLTDYRKASRTLPCTTSIKGSGVAAAGVAATNTDKTPDRIELPIAHQPRKDARPTAVVSRLQTASTTGVTGASNVRSNVTPFAESYLLQPSQRTSPATARQLDGDILGSSTMQTRPQPSTTALSVTLDDVLVREWRSHGWPWERIIAERTARCMQKRGETWMRARLKSVQAALAASGILHDQTLLAAVVSGDAVALDTLNARLSTNQPVEPLNCQTHVPPIMREIGRPDNVPYCPSSSLTRQRTRMLEQPDQSRASLVDLASRNGGQSCIDSDQSEYASTMRTPCMAKRRSDGSSDIGQEAGAPTHPTTGGKTLANIQAITAALRAETEPDSEVDSEIGIQDYCHFAFRVLRQECLDDQQQNVEAASPSDEDEEEDWVECGVFDNLADANTALIRAAFTTYPDRPEFVDGHSPMTLTQSFGEHGEMRCKIVNRLVGTLNLKVQRFLRTLQDGIAPSSKIGWVPRTIYTVRRRFTKEVVDRDEVLDKTESRTMTSEELVNDLCFSALEIANECAIDAFVASTYRPSTNRLQVIDAEKAQLRQNLREQIDIENDYFDHSWEQGRIWVQMGELRGPRNL